MSSWGTKRRNFIITVFASGLFILSGVTIINLLQKDPTCFDGIQNQGELDIDCGGPCALMCPHQVAPPVVRWTRFFRIADGAYNAVAYLENQNPDAKSDPIHYRFTFYSDRDVILAESSGSVVLRPAQVHPILADAISTGALSPSRINFEILNKDNINWYIAAPRTSHIRIRNEQLTYQNLAPRISAQVENTAFHTIRDISIKIIIYNFEGNAIGASKTYIEEILSNQTKDILFTWPQDFQYQVSRFEIIPIYVNN